LTLFFFLSFNLFVCWYFGVSFCWILDCSLIVVVVVVYFRLLLLIILIITINTVLFNQIIIMFNSFITTHKKKRKENKVTFINNCLFKIYYLKIWNFLIWIRNKEWLNDLKLTQNTGLLISHWILKNIKKIAKKIF
jgi:hypothetical protein